MVAVGVSAAVLLVAAVGEDGQDPGLGIRKPKGRRYRMFGECALPKDPAVEQFPSFFNLLNYGFNHFGTQYVLNIQIIRMIYTLFLSFFLYRW